MILDAACRTNGTYWSPIWLYWFSLLRPANAECVCQGSSFGSSPRERQSNPIQEPSKEIGNHQRAVQAAKQPLLALLCPLRPQTAQVLRGNSQELSQLPLL
jgi:hypothetical protein